ncbi:MAG: DUF11 domain-containing protein, partial [Bifidobacteriaceae bacterium]|nr:DUF11 domain-containing protein [Bifidobacteriaceae bacterium]
MFAPNFTLATPTQPTTRLGAIIDSEAAQLTSADARGDDLDSFDDEDAPFPATLDAFAGGTVTIPDIPCTGPGYVQAWLDWDKNGVFDADDAAGTVVGATFTPGPVLCASRDTTTTVDMTFSVPTDALGGPTFARLRIASDADDAAQATGLMVAGEVEDHQVSIALTAYRVIKTSDGTRDARPGDVVTYTVSVTNIGTGSLTPPRTATILDDLTGVLDDADYDADAADDLVNPSPPSTFAFANNLLAWTFAAPNQAETVTLTYSVTLKEGGDRVVRNVVWADNPASVGTPACDQPAGTPDDPATEEACDVETFSLPFLTVSKGSNATSATRPGDQITYTVTATNAGPGDFTPTAPALVMDDLTQLADDATYVDGTAGASRAGTVDAIGSVLSWTGELAAGESVSLTYSVVLTDDGDGVGRNVAWVPRTVPGGGTPSAPVCSASPDPVTGEQCAIVVQGVPRLTVSKQVTGPADLVPGAVLDYTVKIRNSGTAPYTAGAPAVVRDDLTDVIDDATLVDAATTSSSGTVTTDLPVRRVTWTGPLAAGDDAEFTFQVKIAGGGNGRLRNVAWAPNTTHYPGTPPVCENVTPSGADSLTGEPCAVVVSERAVLRIDKRARVNGPDGLRPGTTITYTVTATNQGEDDFTAQNPARVFDSLTGVLADARYNDDAIASTPTGALTWAPATDLLSWSGPLAKGTSVTITYSVTINPFADVPPATGVLRNVAWVPADPNDDTAPACDQAAGGSLDPTTSQPCAVTVTNRPILRLRKTVIGTDPPGRVGSMLHYTITATNIGTAPFGGAYPAEIRDDLADLVDDATYLGDAAVSPDVGSLYHDTAGGRNWLRWSGPLGVNETLTFTYSARLTGAG